jgi:hypothetical protein
MNDQMQTGAGRCLCSTVRFTAAHMSAHVGSCHCHMCRRWGGGPWMVVNSGTDVVFEGEENIADFDSSQWVEQGFCKQCRSHLFLPHERFQ